LVGSLDRQLEKAPGRIQEQLWGIDKRREEGEKAQAHRHEKEILKIRPLFPSQSAQFGSEARSVGDSDNVV
jgi:hypothetical protein